MRKLALLLTATVAAAGCSSVSTRPTGDGQDIEVFTSGAPQRPFRKLSELKVYVDGATHLGPPLDAALPELKRQARREKADAIIDLQENVRGGGEAVVYKITATAIVYVEPSPTESTPAPVGAAPSAPPASVGAGGEAAAPRTPAPPGVDDRDVEVFTSGVPQKPFKKVRDLDMYVERKASSSSALEDALPWLKRQARLAGADAIIDIQLSVRGAGEASVYHVTATAVAYTAPGQPEPAGAASTPPSPSAPASPAAGAPPR